MDVSGPAIAVGADFFVAPRRRPQIAHVPSLLQTPRGRLPEWQRQTPSSGRNFRRIGSTAFDEDRRQQPHHFLRHFLQTHLPPPAFA